jgi:hypothetical protein
MIGDLREEYARYARRAGHERAARGTSGKASASRCDTASRGCSPQTTSAVDHDGVDGAGGAVVDGTDAGCALCPPRDRPAPLLSFTVVVTLALALAANSTTFSLMDALVLRPYRFAGVERLMVATTVAPNDAFFDRINVTAADFREWREQSMTIKDWAMYQWWDANLSGVDVPEQVPGFFVSPGFFELLGSTPIIGRGFTESEAQRGQHHRVVLGHGLWTRRFASDPNIIGKSVRLDGEPYEVVGIAPPGFTTPDGAELWAPIALTDQQWADRRNENFGVLGRLADGATVEQARAELTTIVDTQRRDHPESNVRRFARVMSFTRRYGRSWRRLVHRHLAGRRPAAALDCVREHCQPADGPWRGAFIGVRASPRPRRQPRADLHTNADRGPAAVARRAGGLGAPARDWTGPVARVDSGIRPALHPGWSFIRIDVTLLLATALLGTVAMMAFSLLPAIQAVRAQVSDTLRQSGRSLTPGRNRQWLRSMLAATQIALALALLFASTMSLDAADRTVNGVLGFDKRNVPGRAAQSAGAQLQRCRDAAAVHHDVMDAMRGIPAVTDIGATSIIPNAFNNTSRRFFPEGQDLKEHEARFAQYRSADSAYFAAMKIPLIRGRQFDDSDRVDGVQVAIVSRSLANYYWSDSDPIGKRFKLAIDGPWITVVGVSGDVVHNWFVRQFETVYRPLTQTAPYSVAFAVRTVGDPNAVAGDLRRAVSKVDADQPIASLASMETLSRNGRRALPSSRGRSAWSVRLRSCSRSWASTA